MKGKDTLLYLALGLAFAAVFAFVGPYFWFADLFAHFRPHYAVLAVVLAGVALAMRRGRVAVLCAGIVLLTVPPLLADLEPSVWRGGEPGLRLMAWNMHYRAVDADQGLDMIRDTDADIVILSEVSAAWRERLGALDGLYPYRAHADDCGLLGCEVSILSKRPWRGVRIQTLAPQTPSVIVADFPEFGGVPAFQLVAVHLMNVINGRGGALQLAQISELGKLVRVLPGPVVMAGDMNAAPSSAVFRAIGRETGLASADISLQPTWPSILGWFGIAIDHVFTRGVAGVAVRRLGAGGSDHKALEAAIAFEN